MIFPPNIPENPPIIPYYPIKSELFDPGQLQSSTSACMDKLLIFVKIQKKREDMKKKQSLILDQKHPHLLQYSSQKRKKTTGL